MASRQWSQYLIYIVAGGTILTLLDNFWRVASEKWPYDTIQESILSLIPGFLLILLCVFIALLVFLHFRPEKNQG